MFFPLMSTPGLTGFLDLLYLPPNNWEYSRAREVILYSLETNGNVWKTQDLGLMKKGEIRRFTTSDTSLGSASSSLKLLYPSSRALPSELKLLPEEPTFTTRIPEWRATTGFLSEYAQTSYQGELFPLPSKASLLTFHPFIQYGSVKNKLVILNATKTPEITKGRLLFFNSSTKALIAERVITTNTVTTIDLDEIGYGETELPAIISPDVAGIPFGLGIFKDGQILSMEHTHPPASFVLFGDRFGVQGSIKKRWFSRLLREEK
jgi:hypothetical protein